jgi:hypothetical protein
MAMILLEELQHVINGRLKTTMSGDEPSSGMGGKPASSRASFLTRANSRMPPQQLRSVFHKSSNS